MPSQIGNCNCCKCCDCRCKVVLYKCGGSWSPAPKVKCKKNSVNGRFVFEDSYDCGGCKCCRQEGCTVSKICLDKKYVFKFRVFGHLETSTGGRHHGDIFYRKICCNGRKKSWKRVVHVESEADGDVCCKSLVQDECRIILPKGKYEFKFRADSIDGEDHCGNFLEYDVKWCKYVKNKDCCPKFKEPPVPTSACCSAAINPCCPPPECIPRYNCGQCPPACDAMDPCVAHGWIILSCDDINLV